MSPSQADPREDWHTLLQADWPRNGFTTFGPEALGADGRLVCVGSCGEQTPLHFRVQVQPGSPTVADLGGEPAQPAGAEPRSAWPVACDHCGANTWRREPSGRVLCWTCERPGAPLTWREGEDFRLACRRAVLAHRELLASPRGSRAERAAIGRVADALDAASAFLGRLEAGRG